MTFSHNQLIYLSCLTTPLQKGISCTFHKLTSNNFTHLTKPWVRSFLLSSCQSLMAERSRFTLTQQSPSCKRTILTLQLLENSYNSITFIYTYVPHLITRSTYINSSCNYITSCYIYIYIYIYMYVCI